MDTRIRDNIVDAIAYAYFNEGISRDQYVEMLSEMQQFYENDEAGKLRIITLLNSTRIGHQFKARDIAVGDVYHSGGGNYLVRAVLKTGDEHVTKIRLAAGRTDRGFEIELDSDASVDIWKP